MDKLKQKSESNIDAAKMLLENSLYAPSVHCSYYNCFQLLKYTICHFHGINYESQYSDSKRFKQSAHGYVTSYIVNSIKEFYSSNYKEIKRRITDLRTLRNKSDYAEDFEVSNDIGYRAITNAGKIRNYILKNFNI